MDQMTHKYCGEYNLKKNKIYNTVGTVSKPICKRAKIDIPNTYT